jgi:hypothetical protein
LSTMPIKTISVHACYDDSSLTEIFDEAMAKAETKYLFRLQTHHGSHIECRYSLMTYGLPLGILPVNSDGSVRLEDHEQLLARLEAADSLRLSISPTTGAEQAAYPVSSNEANSPVPTALPPGPMDVVLGRGQRGTKMPGNMLLKRRLEENYNEYNTGNHITKRRVCEIIYDLMHKAGCRFLEPAESDDPPKLPNGRLKAPEAWVELEQVSAVQRIAHKFRNLRSRKG